MSAPGWPRVKEILAGALGRDPSERDAFVEEACGGDQALRSRVESLLAIEGEARSLLDSPVVGAAEDELPGESSVEARLEKMAGQIDTASRYIVKEEIGRGGMGSVVRVFDTDLRRSLAMKVASKDEETESGRTNVDTLARLLEEAQVTGQLDHPGVVPVHELGVDAEGGLYYTMRLVRGRDLREIFELVRAGREGWSVIRALGVLLKVCEAMSFAHEKGVIHRDLKPGNVMVGLHGEVYVVDWGLARVAGRPDHRDLRLQAPSADGLTPIETDRKDPGKTDLESPLVTMDGAVLGTPSYMPPEQAAGEVEQIDARSDVYALGAMIYHLLTGRMPYHTQGRPASPHAVLEMVRSGPPVPVHELARNIPPELEAICHKAMARDTTDRYVDMESLAEDFRAYLEHRVVQAHQTGAVAELRKWVQRNRGWAVTLAAGAMLLIVGALFYVAGISRAQRETERALRTARAQGLAAAAVEALSLDPQLSLLLARRAVETERTPETLSRLHQAVSVSRTRRVYVRGERIHDAEFSPSGAVFVEGGGGGAVWLTRIEDGVSVELDAHQRAVMTVSFSAAGDRLLTTSSDNTARAWNLDGSPLGSFRHANMVRGGIFSPDGRYVLTASVDRTAELWKASGESLAVLENDAMVMQAAFSPSGRHIVTACADGTARVWDFLGEEEGVALRTTLKGHGGPVATASFSPSGDRIVTASGRGHYDPRPRGRPDQTARVWSLDGEELAELAHAGAVEWAGFSPDGSRVLTVSVDGTARLWDPRGQLRETFRPTGSPLLCGAFAPSGETIALTGIRGSAWLFHISGALISRLPGHTGDVLAASFSKDGRWLLTGSVDKSTRLWAVADEELPELVHARTLHYAEYSKHGSRVVTASGDGAARIWTPAGEVLATLQHDNVVLMAVFSPDDENLVLTASRDGTARLWHSNGDERSRLPLGREVHGVAFSPRGDLIATRTTDAVVVWDLQGNERHRMKIEGFGHVAFSPDGTRLLIIDRMRAHLYSLDEDRIRPLSPREVTFGTWSPSGDHVLMAHADGTMGLWAVDGPVVSRPLVQWKGHESSIAWASYSPRGDLVVTASNDGTARIWNLDGNLLSILRGHTGSVRSAVFSSDGTRVLTASWDGTARTWLVDHEELIELANDRILRDFKRSELVRYGDLLGM